MYINVYNNMEKEVKAMKEGCEGGKGGRRSK
jgi:hypothetical protein